jgi:hypothetical protein
MSLTCERSCIILHGQSNKDQNSKVVSKGILRMSKKKGSLPLAHGFLNTLKYKIRSCLNPTLYASLISATKRYQIVHSYNKKAIDVWSTMRRAS